MSHPKKDQPQVSTQTVVIAEAPTDVLLEMRELYRIQLEWGLSKQGRQEVRTKLGAVEITLIERNAIDPEERTRK